MKKILLVAAAAGLMSVAACSKTETPVENNAELVADNLEMLADNVADTSNTTANPFAEDNAEAVAENIDAAADNVRDAASNAQ